MRRAAVIAGALFGAAGVMLGAFGVHALSGRLSPQQAGWWNTAVDYQMWHALALVAAGLVPMRRTGPAVWALGVGTLIFCGTLYLMALGLPRWLGAVAPIGGVAMIAGWLLLGWSALERPDPVADDRL